MRLVEMRLVKQRGTLDSHKCADGYTWNGAYGTQFFADPKEKLVVVGTAAPGELRKY